MLPASCYRNRQEILMAGKVHSVGDFKFRPVNARQKYVQMLHDRGHWITVSNIDTKQHNVTASVYVYDSYQPSDIAKP